MDIANKIYNQTVLNLSQLRPRPIQYVTVEEERESRKQKLASAFRIFSKFGFNEGATGHVTCRDPEFTDTFWVNPYALHFSLISVSDLIRCDYEGNVVEGNFPINPSIKGIHTEILQARPDVVSSVHVHSVYGRAWSTFGKKLQPLNHDVCAFYSDHEIFNEFDWKVNKTNKARRIAESLGNNKALILQNHGLLTVGNTVDEAAWWFICMERSCQIQLEVQAAHNKIDNPKQFIEHTLAQKAHKLVGSAQAGWFQFQPLYLQILKEQPNFLN